MIGTTQTINNPSMPLENTPPQLRRPSSSPSPSRVANLCLLLHLKTKTRTRRRRRRTAENELTTSVVGFESIIPEITFTIYDFLHMNTLFLPPRTVRRSVLPDVVSSGKRVKVRLLEGNERSLPKQSCWPHRNCASFLHQKSNHLRFSWRYCKQSWLFLSSGCPGWCQNCKSPLRAPPREHRSKLARAEKREDWTKRRQKTWRLNIYSVGAR